MLTITRTHAQTYVHAPAQQVPALLPLKETAVQEDQEAHLLETQRGAVHTRHWVLLGACTLAVLVAVVLVVAAVVVVVVVVVVDRSVGTVEWGK